MRELRQRSIGALDERDEQIPLFPKRFIEIGDEGALEVGFGMDIRQVEKVQQVSVFEEGVGGGMKFSHPR